MTLKRHRTRVCPLNRSCQGRGIELNECGVTDCAEPVLKEEWGSWSAWAPCDCGINKRKRIRECLSDACSGLDWERNDCPSGTCKQQPPAPVWSAWTSWSSCSSTCGSNDYPRRGGGSTGLQVGIGRSTGLQVGDRGFYGRFLKTLGFRLMIKKKSRLQMSISARFF